MSSPPPPTSPPSRHSPQRGRQGMQQLSCMPRARSIRPPRYLRRWPRRSWHWNSWRCRNSERMSGPRTPPRLRHPVPPAARAGLPSSRLRRGWSVSPGWRQCWCPGSLRRVRSCGHTSQPSSTRPTATRGRHGSRMTVSSGGKCWLGRTSTGQFPTRDYIMRHSRAARKSCSDASTASQRTMAARVVQHPNPMIVGWFHPPVALPQPLGLGGTTPTLPSASPKAPGADISRNFNAGWCRFSRCRFAHSCSDCAGPHAALNCPRRTAAPQRPLRNRAFQRTRSNPGGVGNQFHPYPPHPGPPMA